MKINKIFCLLLLFQILIPSFSISNERPIFHESHFRTILGFDLQDDSGLQTAILTFYVNKKESGSLKSFIIPFRSLTVESDDSVYLTWGAFIDTTLINYIENERDGFCHVKMTPVFSSYRGDFIYPEECKTGVYLVDYGLEKLFIFNLDPSAASLSSFPEINLVSKELLEAVAVAIPKKAITQEIKDGKTSIPSPSFIYDNVRYFTLSNGVEKVKRIELRYSVPPNKLATLVVEFSWKILGLLIIPIISILLMPKKEIKRKKLRKIFLWVFSILQFLGILFVLYISYKNPSISTKPIFDFLTILPGAILHFIYLRSKS